MKVARTVWSGGKSLVSASNGYTELYLSLSSIECVQRNLTPLTTSLCVMSRADNSKGLTLASSPTFKKVFGMKNVSRASDLPFLIETRRFTYPQWYRTHTDVHGQRTEPTLQYVAFIKFDDKTSNYIDDETALDRALQFNFGFIKAQDVNGSYTGINGRVFRLTPQRNTKGEPLEVTSGQSEDASGFINSGQVNFPNIKFGDYLMEELPQDNDKLQLINLISVTTNTNKDKDWKVTSDKLLQTLKYVADDETVKTQQHRFDTTVDTTKDFDIPDGSKVTYVFTENYFDVSTNPETDEPKAKHDDLKDQDQTLTVDKVTPSIDVEKANAKVPDAENGNHTDKDNNVGVNDHDTEDTYFEVKPNAETKIFFRGTNNGTEPLTHIKVVEKTTNGSVNIRRTQW